MKRKVPSRRKLTELDEQTLRVDAEDSTQRELAALYEVNRATIGRYLREVCPDRPTHPCRRRYPEDVRKRAVLMYLAGRTTTSIAAELGCDAWSVSLWVRKEGVSRQRGARCP